MIRFIIGGLLSFCRFRSVSALLAHNPSTNSYAFGPEFDFFILISDTYLQAVYIFHVVFYARQSRRTHAPFRTLRLIFRK